MAPSFPLPKVITRLPADNVTVKTTTTVHVDFVKGKAGSKAGGLVRCGLDPAHGRSALVRYKVRFNAAPGKKFDFVECGKAGFGFSFGEPGADGGNHLQDGGSARVMWRAGRDSKPGEDATAVAYFYIPNQAAGNAEYKGEKSKVYDVQGPGFRKILTVTNGGDDLWRDDPHPMKFKGDGSWNDVELQVTLNDIGKSNGVLCVSVNGVEKRWDAMVWRTDPKLRLNQVVFNCWFGGADDERYGSPAGQSADFKDVTLLTH